MPALPAAGDNVRAAPLSIGRRAALADADTRQASRVRALAIAAPLVLAVATVAALVVHAVPPVPSDHLNYMDAAHVFPGSFTEPGVVHQRTRIGLVLPMAAAIGLFGYSQAAYYAIPLVTAVALVLGVYTLGMLFFSRSVAIGAAVLTIGNTPVFFAATSPLPDLLATALFLWAFVLAVALRQRHPVVAATARRRAAALVSIGVLLGWSYLTREFIVFLWPLVPLLLFRRVAVRELAWIAVPLAAIGLFELALNQYIFGDPLTRLRAASGHGDDPAPHGYQNQPVAWYLSRVVAMFARSPEGPWVIGALAATVAGGLVRPQRLGLLLVAVAMLYVPLVLLGGVLNPAEPRLRLTLLRYWYPILPFFVLGGIAAAWLVASNVSQRLGLTGHRSRLVAAAVALAVSFTPVAIAQEARASHPHYRAAGATQMEQLRDWLAGPGATTATIWADPRTARVLPIFTRGPFGDEIWNGTIGRLERPEDLARPRPGEHVLVYSPSGNPCYHCRLGSRDVFGWPPTVPASWRVAFATGDGILRLYEVP